MNMTRLSVDILLNVDAESEPILFLDMRFTDTDGSFRFSLITGYNKILSFTMEKAMKTEALNVIVKYLLTTCSIPYRLYLSNDIRYVKPLVICDGGNQRLVID